MYRKFSIFLSSFILSIVFIIASSPFVSASSDTIGLTININQPRADTYSGYIEYLLNDNGKMYARTTFWHFSLDSLTNSQENIFPEVRVTVSNNRIVLTAFINDIDPAQSHNFNWIVGNVNSVDMGSGSDYNCFNLTTTGAINAYWGNAQIMGYKIYGNGVNWDSSVTSGTYNWNVMYSETSMLYELILAIAQSSAGSTGSITQNATQNAENIQQNQNENTDKILNFGSDKGQPDFGATNGKLDDTVGQIESIEGSYQIDQAATNTALSTGTSFLQGSDMQRASIQVKSWIERFSSENRVITGFLIAAMVLGLCFWVIGRKAGSE